jgi:DNA-nicking Smr family endonuclease
MERKPEADARLTDAELFREAIGDVRPIPGLSQAVPKPRPAAEARMLLKDESEALRASRQADAGDAQWQGGETLAYRRPGLPERVFRQLRRGQFSVQDELDLHLLHAPEAEALLKRFLADAIHGRRACVRIIHGKGLRSQHGPVLKALVDRVLRHHGHVLAFASAPPAQGGSGAVLALLRNDG